MEELGVVKYDITNAAIKQMETDYMVLTVKGLDDEAGFTQVHEARMVVKNHRVAVEKKRKDLKADALEWGRKVDSEAKRITGLLEPIETHLQTEEDKVTKEKERIKAEKIRLEVERVEGIRAKIVTIREKGAGYFLFGKSCTEIQGIVGSLMEIAPTPEVFAEFAEEARKALIETITILEDAYEARVKFEKEEADRKAESERLEKVKAEQEIKEAKLKAIQDKLDKDARKVAADKAALEAEKRAEQERKDRVEFEAKAKEDARIKAENDAKAKSDREAREAKERAEAEAVEKARKAALAPDKDKILTWAKELNQCLLDMTPDLSVDEAKRIMFDAEKAIDKAVSTAVKQAKEL